MTPGQSGPTRPLRPDERGQLVLVGAVVLAFLILALVPVYNAVFTADSVVNSGSSEVVESPAAVEIRLQSDARQVAVRVSHTGVYDSESALFDAYRTAFQNYSRVAVESAIRDTGVYQNTSLSTTRTTYGERVVQAEFKPVTNPPGSLADWYVVGPGQGSSLGWFTVKLDTTNLSDTDPFVVRVDNGSETASISMTRAQLSNDVKVVATYDGGQTHQTVCESETNQIVLDLYRGRSANRDCVFPGLNEVKGPVTIEFRNGSSAVATYELVAADPQRVHGSVQPCSSGPNWKSPCSSPAFWEVGLTTRVSGSRTNFTKRTEVNVYGRGG